MDDKDEEVKLPKTDAVFLFLLRGLDEVDTKSLQRVAVRASILDALFAVVRLCTSYNRRKVSTDVTNCGINRINRSGNE